MNYKEALSIIHSKLDEISVFKHPENLWKPIEYLMSMNSKRIRSIFTVLAYSMFHDEIKEIIINVALSWELFHNFTLVHDDIIDHSLLRRGKPTIHTKWDQSTAILSGDILLILAYQYIYRSSEKYRNILLKLFSATALKVCKGQAYDMLFEKKTSVREGEYLRVAYLKTAVLMSSCLYSGAILAKADKNDSKLLRKIGICLGIAFQIQDDLLDVYGGSKIGKQIGGDILLNKRTYLLVSALNILKNNKKNELLFWLNEKDRNEEKIKAVIDLYDHICIKEKACQVVKSYYERALNFLKKINISEERKINLVHLITKLSKRSF